MTLSLNSVGSCVCSAFSKTPVSACEGPARLRLYKGFKVTRADGFEVLQFVEYGLLLV